MDDIYNFVYRGLLTEESLNKVLKEGKGKIQTDDVKLKKFLSIELLDTDIMKDAERMALVYTAFHTFENMVRNFVKKALYEKYEEAWWEKVPSKIRDEVKKRIEQETKLKWHSSRGGSDIAFTYFGDLASIISSNWDIFEKFLINQEWTKSILNTLEKSRNVIMHGGVLSNDDVIRIGMNIRDWITQVG